MKREAGGLTSIINPFKVLPTGYRAKHTQWNSVDPPLWHVFVVADRKRMVLILTDSIAKKIRHCGVTCAKSLGHWDYKHSREGTWKKKK